MATDLQRLPQALPAVPPNDAKAIYINKQKIKTVCSLNKLFCIKTSLHVEATSKEKSQRKVP